MTRALALAAFASLVGAAALGSSAPAATKKKPKPELVNVEVASDYYDPPRITIDRGQRLKWTWVPGFDLHDIYVKKGPERFHSPTQSAGTYSRTFRKPGTFKLYCTQHEMDMTLVVRKK